MRDSATLLAITKKIWPGGVKQFYEELGLTGKVLNDYLRDSPNFTSSYKDQAQGMYYSVQITTGAITALTLYLGQTYSFCGARHVSGFSYNAKLSEACVHEILTAIFSPEFDHLPSYSNRILLGMVERRLDSQGEHTFRGNSKTLWELEEIPPVENPVIVYPHIYSWCKKQRKCKTLGLMWNRNTNNILHNLEVIV